MKKKRGFYTYEAAVLLPIFTFAVLVFLLVFRALSFQWGLFSSVYESSTDLALYGDGVIDFGDETDGGLTGNSLLSPLTVCGVANHSMKKNGVDQSFLSHELGPANFYGTEINDRDIDVRISYIMPLLAGQKFFGKQGYQLGTRVCVRKWNGYDPAAGEGDEAIVYVTEYGEVYHEDLSCTKIKLSIHTARASQLAVLRNSSRHIYHPCEECGDEISGVCYYTDYGERAHSSLTCSKLKRTIRTIPRQEAMQKYRPCSKCALGE